MLAQGPRHVIIFYALLVSLVVNCAMVFAIVGLLDRQ